MSFIGATIAPATPPAVEFLWDTRSWPSPLPAVPFSFVVNPILLRRKIWFAFNYVGAADANFMLDSEIVFSFKGERIFGLPAQYNSRSSATVGTPCDVYWSSSLTVVNTPSAVFNDEPLSADVAGASVNLYATPFRGTFACDKVEWRVARSLITGAERLYSFLAIQSEQPY